MFGRKKPQKAEIRQFTGEFDVLEIKVPRGVGGAEEHSELRTAPMAAEHLFASLHGLLRDDRLAQEHITFELVATDGGITFYTVAPSNVSKFVESQFYAQYPTAHIRKTDDYIPDKFKDGEYKIASLSLNKASYFPLKTFLDFEIDPLSAITSAMTEARAGENLWLQILVRPIPDIWQGAGYDYIESVRGGLNLKPVLARDLPKDVAKEMGGIFDAFLGNLAGREPIVPRPGGGSDRVILSSGQELEIKSIEQKLSKMGFEVMIRLLARAETEDRTDNLLRSLVASMRQFSTANLNSFSSTTRENDPNRFNEFRNRVFSPDKSFILNIEELGAMYHLPSGSLETPGVYWVDSKKGEPPANLPTENCTYMGTTVFRDRKIKFGIKNDGDDRLRHMYLIGKSGTGKSTLFKNMIIQDINNGFGVGVLDPHGELIDDILEYIPDNRIEDVILVDPSDTEHPVGINILELDDISQKNIMASALVSSMATQFSFSWGPRLEYLLNNAVLTLLEVPGTSMLGIVRLLNDMNYQKYILHFVKDPVISDFWEEEYKAMRGNQKLITESVSPIQNKIGRFLASTTIRNILGQRKSTIDFGEVMNSKKILLLNLSKGKIGQDNANLLGALLVSRIQFTAMQRVKIKPEERLPFYLYVDEFQNFAGGEFESILSESRKYKLGLYLTHQFTNQLPEELLAAILGNVGTIATYAIGPQDAKVLETEFAPTFDENDLISLPKFEVYMKLLVDGQTSKPFSAEILKPWIPEEAVAKKTGNKEKVIKRSQEKYGSNREKVEQKVRKWVEYSFDKGKAVAQQYRNEDAAKAGSVVSETVLN